MYSTAATRAKFEVVSRDDKKKPAARAPARPSSSVILVSPSLEILLLHRVQTSSSFPSAHVFPGGNIDKQDGHIPDCGIQRHQDNQAYRVGALRELFEESGILLARQHVDTRQLLSMPQTTREEGRKLVHSGKMPLQTWLHQQHPKAVLDTQSLIPFSHWITPPNLPRRFTTQMYLYILPQEAATSPPAAREPTLPRPEISNTDPQSDFHPTPDANLETTSTTFLPASTWLQLAQAGSIILFPPQFLLLHLISQFLDTNNNNNNNNNRKHARSPQQRIQLLKDFIYQQQGEGDRSEGSSSPWAEKCISPYALPTQQQRGDEKVVLGLDKPGVEVEELALGVSGGLKLRGDRERVVLVKWSKEGPRELEVRFRREVLEEGRDAGRKEGGVKL